MQSELTAADLRHWAKQCDDDAKSPRISGDERDHLLKMKTALLTLAENKDWLEGKRDGRERWDTQGVRNVSFHF